MSLWEPTPASLPLHLTCVGPEWTPEAAHSLAHLASTEKWYLNLSKPHPYSCAPIHLLDSQCACPKTLGEPCPHPVGFQYQASSHYRSSALQPIFPFAVLEEWPGNLAFSPLLEANLGLILLNLHFATLRFARSRRHLHCCFRNPKSCPRCVSHLIFPYYSKLLPAHWIELTVHLPGHVASRQLQLSLGFQLHSEHHPGKHALAALNHPLSAQKSTQVSCNEALPCTTVSCTLLGEASIHKHHVNTGTCRLSSKSLSCNLDKEQGHT
mmetsp:Transcript_13060/g.26096  ORF Transcript_13060/g.26096 Transcript_13060/m.26096 type:complete len:267 (+) Transcript_13060:1382-2182(+)